MPDSPSVFEIRFDPETSKKVSRFVVAGFFKPREFPQAFVRFLFTREFVFYVGIPLLLGTAGNVVLWRFPSPRMEILGNVLLWGAVVWMVAGLIRVLRTGKGVSLGCYALGEGGAPGSLAGGLRIKVQKARRRICLAGVLVEPSTRGKGVFTALMVGAFRMAAKERAKGPLTLSIFSPTHPASKKVIHKYLEGRLDISVEEGTDGVFPRSLARLEEDLREIRERGVDYRFSLLEEEGRFFGV